MNSAQATVDARATSTDSASSRSRWIVTPDAPRSRSCRGATIASAALDRLYALGLDAFRVAAGVRRGRRPSASSLDGATGQVDARRTRASSRARAGFAMFRGGALVPLDGAR